APLPALCLKISLDEMESRRILKRHDINSGPQRSPAGPQRTGTIRRPGSAVPTLTHGEMRPARRPAADGMHPNRHAAGLQRVPVRHRPCYGLDPLALLPRYRLREKRVPASAGLSDSAE